MPGLIASCGRMDAGAASVDTHRGADRDRDLERSSDCRIALLDESRPKEHLHGNVLFVGLTALALTAGSESFAQAVAVEVAPWGPALTKYRYVYWNNQVVLVEPSSWKVIHVIN
jgi:hypothetical protein